MDSQLGSRYCSRSRCSGLLHLAGLGLTAGGSRSLGRCKLCGKKEEFPNSLDPSLYWRDRISVSGELLEEEDEK